MKRRMTIPLLALTAVLALGMGGCGRTDDTVSDTETEDVTASISVTVADDDGTLLKDMTREELSALTADEVKDLMESQLPNYRDIFLIEDDYEMTDADWLTLRDALIYQMYGTDTSAVTDNTIVDSGTEDPDRIYYAPTADEINAMTTAEFAEYLNGMYAYFGTDIGVDFTTLSDEIIENRRAELLKTIQ